MTGRIVGRRKRRLRRIEGKDLGWGRILPFYMRHPSEGWGLSK
jgi:hypothetical protein